MFDHIQHPIPIPMEDDRVHTDHDPFCYDPDCPCHCDSTLIAEVNQQYQDGLLTADEATNYVMGKTL